ncbi:MAG: vitamin K epoxide reductase family protein [Armatimonadetes bacterium]|nr:vitamin K epoxide reductase family protein [Armatimonadota bacterium]MBS1725431.1 vitamin K epoxide reductase family protein [Armatimonadota bacterium]
MSPLTLNRILLILGVVGLYVSGVLSAEHLFEIQIPCTSGGGCAVVARHPSSYIFGTLPVAYVGFGGYFLLTALALVRLATGDLLSRILVGLGYMGAAVGVITSIYLQYVSLTQIRALCVWCMSSAITMVITFIFYTILFGKVGSVEVEKTRSPKSLFQGLAGVALAAFAIAGTVYGRQKEAGKIEIISSADAIAKLVPEPRSERNQIGPDDAPVTVVEYADLCCPTCRQVFPKVHDLAAKYSGKIRIIYRHFPLDTLPGHQMAIVTAVASELAAEKGKFWDYATAFTAPEEAPTTREGVEQIAQTVGVSGEEITKAIQNSNSPAQTRVMRDLGEALGTFGIKGTPTFLLSVPGKPIERLSYTGLTNELESRPIQDIMNAKK